MGTVEDFPTLRRRDPGEFNEAAGTQKHLIEVDDAHARQAADALVALKNQVQNGKDILLRGANPAQLEKYWGAFQKYEQAAQAATEKLAADLPASEARSKIERFNLLHKELGQSYRKALDLFKASGFAESLRQQAAQLVDCVAQFRLCRLTGRTSAHRSTDPVFRIDVLHRLRDLPILFGDTRLLPASTRVPGDGDQRDDDVGERERPPKALFA